MLQIQNQAIFDYFFNPVENHLLATPMSDISSLWRSRKVLVFEYNHGDMSTWMNNNFGSQGTYNEWPPSHSGPLASEFSVSWIPRMNFTDDGKLKFTKEFYCKLKRRKQLERSKKRLLPRHPLGANGAVLGWRMGSGWDGQYSFPSHKVFRAFSLLVSGQKFLVTSSCIPPKQLWSLQLLCKRRKINARSEKKNQCPEASLAFLASELQDKGAGLAQDISCCQEAKAELFV